MFIRHAETTARPDVLLGRNNEVGLSSRGFERANRLAQYLKGLPIQELWSSPLRRAVQTATPIAEQLATPIQLSESLNELDYGRWTGRCFNELEGDSGWRSFNYERHSAQIPGGESVQALERRVVEQIHKWNRKYAGQCIAAVTHAEIIRVAVLLALGRSSNSYDRIEISPCSVTILQWDAGQGRIMCMNASPDLKGFEFQWFS